MEDPNFPLSPLDHLTPRRHLLLFLYFPLTSPDITVIASKLKSSLQRTFETLPILSGTVQPARQSEQSGSLCVGAPWNAVDDVFRVNDLTASDLDYENLRQNHFPMTTSQRHDLCSIHTSRPIPFGFENPVMMAQVNFILNGMILVPFLHHSFMDGLGGATVMELWATFCRGDNGTETISGGMMDRERLMFGAEASRWEGFPEYVNGSETYESGQKDIFVRSGADRLSQGYSLPKYVFNALDFFKRRLPAFLLPAISVKETSSAPQIPKDVDSEIFFIPRSKLAKLKSVLSAFVASAAPSPGDSRYISTNDALSALLFACVTEARRPIKSNDPQQTIPFAITVSGRRLLTPPLPDKYVGNMSLFCHLDLPLTSVTAESHNVAAIAHRIRKRLRQLDDSYVNRLIGALRTVDDTAKVAPACRASKEWQFMVTPWTTQGYYSMDWGSEIGAKCERVRVRKVSRPAHDGANLVFPELKVENGIGEEEAGLEVMVALERSAMRRLKGMEEWTRWAQWRCS